MPRLHCASSIHSFRNPTALQTNGDGKMNNYRTKSEAELRYIIKDASEAAQAMRGMDYKAECKYLDQVNDACTELSRRGA